MYQQDLTRYGRVKTSKQILQGTNTISRLSDETLTWFVKDMQMYYYYHHEKLEFIVSWEQMMQIKSWKVHH